MAKLVTGIVLLSIFLLFFLSGVSMIIIKSPNPAQLQALLKGVLYGWLGMFIIFGIPGILYTYWGNRAIKTKRSILSNAIQMLYKENEIDISALSENNGLDDEETKEIVASFQRKGIIPSEVQI